MTERERLRKLIDVFIDNKDFKSYALFQFEDLTDYLLANGVTVREEAKKALESETLLTRGQSQKGSEKWIK